MLHPWPNPSVPALRGCCAYAQELISALQEAHDLQRKTGGLDRDPEACRNCLRTLRRFLHELGGELCPTIQLVIAALPAQGRLLDARA